MLMLKTDNTLSNANLPTFQTTASERAIASLSPSTWLEGDGKYIQVDSSGNFLSWVDRTSGRRYVPARAESPGLATYNAKLAVRFGFRPNVVTSLVTVNNNGVLKPEGDWEALSSSGTSTQAYLFRLPKPKGQAGSELTGSADSNSGGVLLGSAGAASYMLSTSVYGTGVIWGFNKLAIPLISPDNNYDDAVWHYAVASFNLADNTATLRVDGVQVATNTLTLTAQDSVAGAKQLVIGGGGIAYDQSRLVGDLGAVMYFADFAAHKNPAALTAIEAHLQSLKTAMS